MAEKGWGSYFMHSRVGLVTGYLSDEWMDLVNACADEAEKTGTYAWLYDEDKWPSGYASGVVPLQDEAFRSRTLVLLSKSEKTDNDSVLTRFEHDGVEYLVCARRASLGSLWFNKTCYVDLMNPKAVRAFLDCTHEKYKKACGKHFGKAIPGVFTDEPAYRFHHGMPPGAPWSEYLPAFFKTMHGYDIKDHLPEIFFEFEGYQKVRLDFYTAASELFRESFSKQYYDWCDANNLKLTGHFLAEDDIHSQTSHCGDAMSHYEFMHWPGIDKLGLHLDQIVTVKQVTSAVDQLGKERAFCEVFGCVGGQVSFFHRKWIADWQAALGISFINHHLSLYSMRGERKRDYPANLFYQQAWWEDEREFADYQGRLCAAVSEGKRQVDILVIHPLTSGWCEFSPVQQQSNFAPVQVFDKPFEALSRKLSAEKLDYHYGSETLMKTHGRMIDGKLAVGIQIYKCVIVPPACNLRSSTLALLQEFAEAGGEVIVVGGMPTLVDGCPAKVRIKNAKLVMDIDQAVELAGKDCPGPVKVTDKLTGGNAGSVYSHVRTVGDSTRVLLSNISKEREVRAIVDLSALGKSPLAAFDMADGSVYTLVERSRNQQDGTFEVTLWPAGSLLIIAGPEAQSATEPVPVVMGSGASFCSKVEGVPDLSLSGFECEVMEDNVLLLNDFSLQMDGKQVYEGAVAGAWHEHFYPAPDGTPFRATYSFYSEVDVDGCFAAIEVAENLDSMEFNGSPLKAAKQRGELGAFDPAKSWKDINFTRVVLPRIKAGWNTLVISGKKVNNITSPGCHIAAENWREHKATEAEEVYICGKFGVVERNTGVYVITEFNQPCGRDLNTEGFPFYCGRIKMTASFDLLVKPEGQALLRLVEAECACAEIRVNGKPAGTLRWAPFVADVTGLLDQGINTIEIELVTTLVNCFGPNRIANIKGSPWVGPGEFVALDRLKKTYEFFDFGLGGVALYL